MADAAGRFQNGPALKSEPPSGLIHGLGNDRGSVMGIEGGGANGTMLRVGQDFGKLDLFLAPVGIVHVEHLGHRTPANIFDQQGFFVWRSRTIFWRRAPARFR